MVLNIQQINNHPQLGVDEIYYFDYALKSPSLGVRIGEQVGVEAMTTAGCRGIEIWPEELIPECGDPQPDPNQLWQSGYNVMFQHPPAYFTITAVGGKVMSSLPGVHNKLTAYRLVGVLWLIAGMSLLWYALGLLGVGVISKAALVSLLGAPTAAVYVAASVHAGNARLIGGCLLLVALLLWEKGRWRWWSVPAVSGIAVWLSLNNAFAVGAIVAYLAYRAWKDEDRRRDLLVTATSSLAVAVVSVVGWQAWQNYRKLADVQDLPIHQVSWGESGFQWQQIDDELRAVFTPFRDQWLQTWEVLTPLSGIADIGLILLMATTLVATSDKSTFRYFTAGVVTAMVGAGVVTMLSTFGAGYNYFQLTPARHGLALLPLAAVAITPAILRIDLARFATIALAVAIFAAVAYGVLADAKAPQEFEVVQAVRQSQQEQTLLNQQQLISEQEQLIADQREFIGEQEDMLNSYRCRSRIDVELVSGRC